MITDEVKMRPFSTRLGLGVLVACAFVLISSVELEGQGLPFDEIPLAPASFLYLGKAPYSPHTVLTWKTIPLLAVTYIGAIKSNCFGVAMKYLHVHFSVTAWRLVGILFVALGLLIFTTVSFRVLSLRTLFIFVLLFFSDITVLLYARVDWGPMALSLMCRLIWLAAWLREEFDERKSSVTAFVLGFVPSLLVYEKLNNVVFFLPLAAIILQSKERRTFQYLKILIGGLVVGALPFILVNVMTDGISFRQIGSQSSVELTGRLSFITFAKIFLGLGAGQEVKSFVLGDVPTRWIKYAEISLISGLLLAAAVVSFTRLRSSKLARTVAVMVFAYYGVGLATWLLPRGTGIHHWIVSTPFQYCAIALIVPLRREIYGAARGWSRGIIPTMIAALLVLRIINLLEIEGSLWARHSSRSWNIDLTKATKYFAYHHSEGNFIAADYGFGAQTYCFSNGDFILSEPFWNYEGRQQLQEMIKKKKNAPIYVIYNAETSVIGSDRRARILADLHDILGPRMLPLEPALKELTGIIVEKHPNPFNE